MTPAADEPVTENDVPAPESVTGSQAGDEPMTENDVLATESVTGSPESWADVPYRFDRDITATELQER